MTKEKFFSLREKINNKEIEFSSLDEKTQEEFGKLLKVYAKDIVAEHKEKEKHENGEMLYKEVKGLKRPVRVGNICTEFIQIDQTGETIGKKVRRFLQDNEVNFEDINLEYDEEESVEDNPDWSGDNVEYSEIDDISFDNIDAVDKMREYKDKILTAQTSVVEPGDVSSDKLQTTSNNAVSSQQQNADEGKQNKESTQ